MERHRRRRRCRHFQHLYLPPRRAFTPWLTDVSRQIGIYRGIPGHAYGFYNLATDLVGNVEPAKTAVEATETADYKNICPEPSISGTISSATLNPSGSATVNLEFSNQTTGDGANVDGNRISSAASGASVNSPALPLTLGNAPAGRGENVALTLTVPDGVTSLRLTETGTVADRSCAVANFSTTQAVTLGVDPARARNSRSQLGGMRRRVKSALHRRCD